MTGSNVSIQLNGPVAGVEVDVPAAYIGRLTALRNAFPALQAKAFFHGEEILPDLHNLDWFDDHGNRLEGEDWDNQEGRALAIRRVTCDENGPPDPVLLLVNAWEEPLEFTFPAPSMRWCLLLESAMPEIRTRWLETNSVTVAGHSVMLLATREPGE